MPSWHQARIMAKALPSSGCSTTSNIMIRRPFSVCPLRNSHNWYRTPDIGSSGIMYQLDLPWLLLLLPLPLIVHWLFPPHHAASPSVRLPFFEEVAKAAGVTPARGSVAPRRSRSQVIIETI